MKTIPRTTDVLSITNIYLKEDFDFANSDNYLHKLGMKLGGVKYYPKGGTTNS
jgi:dihydroorotase